MTRRITSGRDKQRPPPDALSSRRHRERSAPLPAPVLIVSPPVSRHDRRCGTAVADRGGSTVLVTRARVSVREARVGSGIHGNGRVARSASGLTTSTAITKELEA